jgi:hypothetical protein
MMRFLLAITIAAGAMALDPRGADARGAPWCAEYSLGPGSTVHDCLYWSFEACLPYATGGNRGFCVRNPAYVGPPPKVHRARWKHRVILR